MQVQKALCPWAVHTKLSQITPQRASWGHLYFPFSRERILNQKTLEQKGPWVLNLSPTLQMGVGSRLEGRERPVRVSPEPLRILGVWIPAHGSQVGTLLGFLQLFLRWEPGGEVRENSTWSLCLSKTPWPYSQV